jgi:hypothetical protein
VRECDLVLKTEDEDEDFCMSSEGYPSLLLSLPFHKCPTKIVICKLHLNFRYLIFRFCSLNFLKVDAIIRTTSIRMGLFCSELDRVDLSLFRWMCVKKGEKINEGMNVCLPSR